MLKSLIRVRAKFFLPFKWTFWRIMSAIGYQLPKKVMLIRLHAKYRDDILVARRKRDLKEEYRLRGKVDLLEAIFKTGIKVE